MALAPAYKGNDAYVFVSYSHVDSALVAEDLAWFQEHNLNVWYDEGIEGGTEWREEIARALKNASLVLFYVSENSVVSENCRKEVNLADLSKVPILPVLLSETELPTGLDLTLSDRQAIHRYSQSDHDYRTKLHSRLLSYLGSEFESGQPEIRQLEADVSESAAAQLPRSKAKNLSIAALAVAVAIGAASYYLFVFLPQTLFPGIEMSVAVLPFENTNHDPELESFVTSLSEATVRHMADAQPCMGGEDCGFRAIPRRESFNLGANASLSEVHDQLNANFAVTGGVIKLDEGVQVNVELSRTTDGFLVWSRAYQGSLTNPAELQNDFALHISHLVAARVWHDRFAQLQETLKPYNTFGMYKGMRNMVIAMGEFVLIRSGEGGSWQVFERLTKLALEEDPNIGFPNLMLANAYWQRLNESMALEDARRETFAALSLAERLYEDSEPKSAIFLNSIRWQRGQAYIRLELDYRQGKEDLQQVMDFTPLNMWPYYWMANIALREGRRQAVTEYLSQASKLQGGIQQPVFHIVEGMSLLALGEYERAVESTRKGLKLSLEGSERAELLRLSAAGLQGANRFDEARELLDEAWKMDGDTNAKAYMRLLYADGQHERVRDLMAQLTLEPATAGYMAETYTAMGDLDRAFEAIEVAVIDRDYRVLDSLRFADWWIPVRDDPRYTALLDLIDSMSTYTDEYQVARDKEAAKVL